LFAIYASVILQFVSERLAKEVPYGTLATTAPFYNISTLAIEIKHKYKLFRKAQRAACKAARKLREPQFDHPWYIKLES